LRLYFILTAISLIKLILMRPLLILGVLLLLLQNLFSQNVGIGTTNPDGSAVLDINSTSKGILVPKMTEAQMLAIVSPQTGLMVFQTDGKSGFYYNSGTPVSSIWVKVGDVSYPSSFTSLSAYYTASVNYFYVPAGVHKIFFEMVGGGAGAGGSYLPAASTRYGGGGGGGGGFAKGYINVTPDEKLTISVGSGGTNGTNSSTSATAGTAGFASSIVSGITTIISVNGGAPGEAGSSSGSGMGGIGGFIGSYSSSRCIVSSYIPQVWFGGTGLSVSPPSLLTLTGVAGAVPRYGEYNIVMRDYEAVAGAGTTEISMPYYGKGGGYGSGATQGYVVIYW
jgi:hypothetical protein